MKSTNVALLSLAGMLATGLSVYSMTPPGGAIAIGGSDSDKASEPVTREAVDGDTQAAIQPSSTSLGRFTSGSTIMVEGRAGHPKLLRSRQGET
jgi:Ca-activated chloride channel family protein